MTWHDTSITLRLCFRTMTRLYYGWTQLDLIITDKRPMHTSHYHSVQVICKMHYCGHLEKSWYVQDPKNTSVIIMKVWERLYREQSWSSAVFRWNSRQTLQNQNTAKLPWMMRIWKLSSMQVHILCYSLNTESNFRFFQSKSITGIKCTLMIFPLTREKITIFGFGQEVWDWIQRRTDYWREPY